MHIPYNATTVGSFAPISGVGISLHEFAKVSWHILMPYTLLGAGIMVYSQSRLMRGQRVLKREASASPARTDTKKA